MEKETKLQILETAMDQAYKLLSITDTDEMGSEQVKRLLENLSSLMYTHERVKYPYEPNPIEADFTSPAPKCDGPEQSYPTADDTEPGGDTETAAPVPETKPTPAPEPAKPMSLVEVRTTLADLSGRANIDLPGLLAKFGAEKLSLVDPANYAALVQAAKTAAGEA